jgi:hypothetical protein
MEREPSTDPSWVAIKVILAACGLTLAFVFVIDVGGGH